MGAEGLALTSKKISTTVGATELGPFAGLPSDQVLPRQALDFSASQGKLSDIVSTLRARGREVHHLRPIKYGGCKMSRLGSRKEELGLMEGQVGPEDGRAVTLGASTSRGP